MRGPREETKAYLIRCAARVFGLLIHPIAIFLIGIALEAYAGYLVNTLAGKSSPVDEVVSLLGISLMVLAAIWYLRLLGGIPWELIVAAGLIVTSKFLEVIANMYGYNMLPVFGRDDMRSRTIQSILFTAGAIIMLLGVFRFARRIWMAKNELEWRHAQLICEQKEREAVNLALEESKRMLQRIIESIPEAVFWKDRKSRYIGCNQRHVELLGMERLEEVLGKSDMDFPWLEEHVGVYLDNDRIVMEQNTAIYGVIEPVHYRKGGMGWVRTSKVPLYGPTGDVIGVLGTVEDITERKQHEDDLARLGTALKQADESVIITDPGGNIQYVNPAFERVSGYTAAEVIGGKPRLLRTDMHPPEFYENLWQTISRGDVWHGHFINRRKDGVQFEEQATISPVRNESGDIINYVALKRDVTRERKLERQLSQAQKMEAIGQLAGGVAHDFNNLLQVVSGYAEMALNELPKDSRAFRTLEHCRSAIGRAAKLVRQLLVFGRRQGGQLETLDTNAVVSDMLKMVRRLIGEHVELHFSPGYEQLMIFADPTQIEQVILNLCVNARDAMPGGGKILIETAAVRVGSEDLEAPPGLAPGEYVRIAVSDTGVGIPVEVMEHIFEPFFSTKEMGQGAGLGLATVYGIIQQHKGGIIVNSSPGQGTTFHIFLPVMPHDAHVGIVEDVVIDEDALGGSETILVAEDEEMVRELAREILLSKGYCVLEACDGVDAMHVFDEHEQEIQLVLTDVVMPRAGGMQLCAHVKERRPNLPVVFCSGYSREVLERRLQHIDTRNIVQKPYSRVTLLLRVRKALDEVRILDIN